MNDVMLAYVERMPNLTTDWGLGLDPGRTKNRKVVMEEVMVDGAPMARQTCSILWITL